MLADPHELVTHSFIWSLFVSSDCILKSRVAVKADIIHGCPLQAKSGTNVKTLEKRKKRNNYPELSRCEHSLLPVRQILAAADGTCIFFFFVVTFSMKSENISKKIDIFISNCKQLEITHQCNLRATSIFSLDNICTN